MSKTKKNPGRPFYTCQDRKKGCDFFLWCDDAVGRVDLRSASEQSIGGFFRNRPDQETRDVGGSSHTLDHVPDAANDLLGDMSSGEENSLVRMADEMVVQGGKSPGVVIKRENNPGTLLGAVTPPPVTGSQTTSKKRKVAHNYVMSEDESDQEAPPSTPTRPRTQISGGLPTPVTAQREPASKRQRTDPFVASSATLESSQPNQHSDETSTFVISLLRTQRIDPAVLEQVKDFLGKNDTRVKGITAARDMLREDRKRLLEQNQARQEQIIGLRAQLKAIKEALNGQP
jgi:hypothetical protein